MAQIKPKAAGRGFRQTLPVIRGEDLLCPYCRPEQQVRLVKDPGELESIVRDVSRKFNVRPRANYQLAGLCDGCSTVWLAEEVDPKTNEGKPYAWDRFSASGPRFKK